MGGYAFFADEDMTHVEAATRSKASPIGMRVPKGGSQCGKCEYLKDAEKQLCGNKNFIAWNGGAKFSAPADEYCCNYFDFK